MSARPFFRLVRAMCLTGAVVGCFGAQAAPVTFTSTDGSVDISGELIAYEDNTYVVRTLLGTLRLSAAKVRCAGAGCPETSTETADVMIAGSETMGLGLMPLLLDGYAVSHGAKAVVTATAVEGEYLAQVIGDQGLGAVRSSFLVSATSSNDAFTKLMERTAEIGMSTRAVSLPERDALSTDGAGDMRGSANERLVAVDNLVVITHPDNPITHLSVAQLGDIFAGRILNWRAVGGPDAPILVIDRKAGSDTRQTFDTAVFEEARTSSAPIRLYQSEDTIIASAIRETPFAIGFVSHAFRGTNKIVPLVDACGVELRSDAFSARTEDYPMQRRFYLYSRTDTLSDDARSLLDFALSDAANDVIQSAGFVDLGVQRRKQDPASAIGRATEGSGPLSHQLRAEMALYDRLSTTFRFTFGSPFLDRRARQDLERLTTFLQRQPKGTRVKFVGFTDDVGGYRENKALSKRRAKHAMQALIRHAGVSIDNIELAATGFGEAAPTACNATDSGRRINRRVEVWIRTPRGS